jgi:hypothetical protein
MAIFRMLTLEVITRDDCNSQIFKLIVELNCNKILGRLGSSLFRAPTHLRKLLEPLPVRLQQVYRQYVPARLSSAKRMEADRLIAELASFEAAFEELEKSKPENVLSMIKLVIMEAFLLTENGVNLPERLQTLGFPNSILDARDVREVGKVSNYWRISRHLTVCSQRFRQIFKNAEWHPLTKYGPSLNSQIIARQFVHAEIQILIHYELKPVVLMPRAIGASKEACFLCDSFIRAHGSFSVTGAHRQIFDQWTVPDLVEYNKQTISRIRRALSQVCKEVMREYIKMQKKQPWRPFPLQSAINLNVIQIKTPSISTLRSHPTEISSTTASTLRPTGQLIRQQERSSDRGTSGVSSLHLLPSKEPKDSTDSLRDVQERTLEVTVGDKVSAYRDWVHLSAYLTSSSNAKLTVPPLHGFKNGSVLLESSTGSECRTEVRLADIPSNEELVIQRCPDDSPGELTFILIGNRGQRVLIRCKWLD